MNKVVYVIYINGQRCNIFDNESDASNFVTDYDGISDIWYEKELMTYED